MRKFVSMLTVLMLFCTLAFGQTRTITGTVKDENGNPLPFATITEAGTKNGTTADEKGNFSLTIKEKSRLSISATGHRPQTINVSGNTVNLILSREGNLQEVVVTSLGIRRTDKSLGYSVGKVAPEALVQKSEPDVLKGLQGKVAGVDIRASQGTPGAATRIQIRGNNSFFGNSQPLIIVDGVPYSNDQVTTSSQTSGGTAYSSGIANLDPNDIASMNVLKGSSAAALYGSRASNGVLVITTKSGSAGRSKKGTEITFKSSVSLETIANLPDYQNSYGAGSYGSYSNSNGSWGPNFKDLDSIQAWGEYYNAYPELFPSSGNIAYKAYPNNVKDLFRTGTVYENSIGFNSGDEKSSFALTGSQLTHNGYVPNSSYKRYNIGAGGATKLSMGLNISANFNYARSTQKGGYFGENQVDGAASLFARSLFLARNWDLNLPFEDENGTGLIPNGGAQFDNPRWSAKYNVATTNEERFIAGVRADYNINKWIRVDYSIGNNVNTLDRREITEIGSRAASGQGRLVLDNYRKQEIESNLLLTFSPSINNDFSFKTVLGNNFNQRTTTRQTQTGNKFITRGIYTLSNTAQQTFGRIVNGEVVPGSGDYYERRRIIGLFGDVSLGYKNFAFINVTGRNDWSSTLPVESRSYFYPSISGSFVFTDAFQLNSRVLDFGKVRAGWAKVGRDADPYSLQDVFALGVNFLGQPTGTRSTTTFNQNLKPEFTREIEAGTNLSFFRRRAEIDFTWYSRYSTNLIAPVTIPSSSGYSEYYTNFGKISNKGIEVDLTVRPILTNSFSWEIRGAFTKNKNMVVELTEGVENFAQSGVLTGISPYFEAGMPYGYLRGTVSARDDEGNLLIDPATGGTLLAPEETFVGNPNPDYKLGITNTLSYKGFSLSALFDMTKGGDMYSVTVSSLLGRGVTMDTEDRETSWVIPGVYGDPNTNAPILVGGKKMPNQTRITTNDLYFSPSGSNTFAINTATEWNVYDATVYRLREVNLAYNFPKSLFNKLPIGSLSLSLTGRNLWFLAPNIPKYTNFDPEVNSFGASAVQGIELSAAPTTRRFGFNLSATF
jgi:TonB-linked SusC/RagA family outer membrane protein